MRNARRGIRLAMLGALVMTSIVFVIDRLQPSPIMADVVERDSPLGTFEQATVVWTDDEGATQTARLIIPERYVGDGQVPVVGAQVPYVSDGSLSLHWYVWPALFGALVAGPIGLFLRPQDYEEKPMRQVTAGAGV